MKDQNNNEIIKVLKCHIDKVMTKSQTGTVDMIQRLIKVEEQVRLGFKEVHRRQDVANGRTGKLEIRVDELSKLEAVMNTKLDSNTKSDGKLNDRIWDFVKYILVFIIGALLTKLL